MLVCQCVSPIILLLGVQQATTDGDQLLAASNSTRTAVGMCIYKLVCVSVGMSVPLSVVGVCLCMCH